MMAYVLLLFIKSERVVLIKSKLITCSDVKTSVHNVNAKSKARLSEQI